MATKRTKKPRVTKLGMTLNGILSRLQAVESRLAGAEHRLNDQARNATELRDAGNRAIRKLDELECFVIGAKPALSTQDARSAIVAEMAATRMLGAPGQSPNAQIGELRNDNNRLRLELGQLRERLAALVA